MIFFADGIAIREKDEPRGSLARSGYEIVEMEPMPLLPAPAAVTHHIGLVTTASTTSNEPYHVARKLATIDLVSGGRAGWNIVTSWSEAEARNFNREEHLDCDIRYERAAEFSRRSRACGTSGNPVPSPMTSRAASSSMTTGCMCWAIAASTSAFAGR